MRVLYIGQGPDTNGSRRLKFFGENGRLDNIYYKERTGSYCKDLLRRVVHVLSGYYLDLDGLKGDISEVLSAGDYDLIWLDKPLWLTKSHLRLMRDLSSARIIIYHQDDFMNKGNFSLNLAKSACDVDRYYTTKSFNVSEYKQRGIDSIFVNNTVDPEVHCPTIAEKTIDIVFVGAYERDRSDHILYLLNQGLDVKVFGPGWSKSNLPKVSYQDCFLRGLEYAKVISSSKIVLAFLRKVNRDLQTNRSVELPAMKAFMVAERSSEHIEMFKDGDEALFFSSYEELYDICISYLYNEDERSRIAENGYKRVYDSGYTNEALARKIWKDI